MRSDGKGKKLSKEVNVTHALHKELAELYRGKSTDTIRITKLWQQIERLEAIEDATEH